MTAAWNYERRRAMCAGFLVGVWLITKGRPGVATSLEAVRSRMGLPPDGALFAARQLDEEALITFEVGGVVQSTPQGIENAEALLQTARTRMRDFAEVTRTVRSGGLARELLKVALVAHGGPLDCEATGSEGAAPYRLTLTDDTIVIERQGADGAYEVVSA